MLPYMLLLLFSALLPFLFYYRYRKIELACGSTFFAKKRNEKTILLFFVGLFVLLALRDISVGIDLVEYKSIFETCGTLSFKQLPSLRWEIGYAVYNKLMSLISKDFRFFLIITALLTLIPIYVFYSREKKYSLLLIVLFLNMPCFLMMFSGLRQAMAISIGILAYMAIEKRKHFLGILLILLAATFHVSAYILFLIYPAFFFKIKARTLLYIVPVLAVIYFFRIPILTALIAFMPSQYIEFYGEVQETGAVGMMVLFLVFTVFSFVILDEETMTMKDYHLRNIMLIATVFQFFVPVHGLVQRASYYFLIFVPVSLISVVQAPKRKLKNVSDLAVVVMLCFFTLYFFYNASFTTDNLLDVFPYKFFWSGKGW